MKPIFFLGCISLLSLLSLPAVHACERNCGPDYAQTRYPIVLVHGMFGWDSILGFNHFYQIPEDLRRNNATVYVAQVSALNSPEVRGEQLLAQVEEILALTGAEKVNLIGQSHGSPTIRYVAAVAPHLVASATSIGGPVKGTPIADLVQGIRDIPIFSDIAEPIIVSVVNAIGNIITFISGNQHFPQNAIAGLESVTVSGIATFNARYPQAVPTTECGEGEYVVNNVHYYSWSGGKAVTNLFDPLDYFAAITTQIFKGKPSDSLISTCASHLGQVIRDDYRMNHYDEVNQTLGIVSLLEANPKSVYRQHANRLKNAGL